MTLPFEKRIDPILKMITPLFKKILLIYLAIVLSVPIINFFISKSIVKDRKSYLKHVKLIQNEAPLQTSAQKKRKHKLVPADPKKYGMVVVPSVNLPNNQEHADVFMKNVIKESGILEKKEVIERIREEKISPAEFEQKSKLLDEKISAYEAKKAQSPLDEDEQGRLQQLYLLKSFQNAFKDTAVTPDPVEAPTPSPTEEATAGEDPSPEQQP